MKTYIIPFIVFMLLMPFVVNAETCDADKISVESIKWVEKSENVKGYDDATVNGRNVNLNLIMSDVGDNIKYKIVVKNTSNEDYELNKNSFKINSDYIDYTIISEDNSNIVKSKSSKTLFLKVEYKTEVPKNKFVSEPYNDNKSMVIPLSYGDSWNIKNPNTGVQYYLIIVTLLIICGISFIVFRKKKFAKYFILIIGIYAIVPISIYALCKSEIKLNSIVHIYKHGYNPCTFDGELVPGTIYTNGQYTYRYKQEKVCDEICRFMDIEEDGWCVYLPYDDPNIGTVIDTKLCTSINGKNVVSARSLFEFAHLDKLDLTKSSTSNITNMKDMFYGLEVDELDLSNLDTSNVTDMSSMFDGTNTPIIDISNFDTSKVTDMRAMFLYSHARSINLSNLDTSKVTDMSYMFHGSEVWDLDLSGLNTQNVMYMTEMFSRTRMEELDLSSFDTSNVIDMRDMFYDCSATIGYARTQADADRFNSTSDKPEDLTFVVKN